MYTSDPLFSTSTATHQSEDFIFCHIVYDLTLFFHISATVFYKVIMSPIVQ
jgi:hypothetical protein